MAKIDYYSATETRRHREEIKIDNRLCPVHNKLKIK